VGDVYAYKTLAAAYDLLRNERPDWLLLKRGDVWEEAFPSWGKSGSVDFEGEPDTSRPLLVAAFGSALAPRPAVTGGNNLTIFNTAWNTPPRNLAISSLHFRNPSPGEPGHIGFKSYSGGLEAILIENCLFDGTAISIQNASNGDHDNSKNLTVRRCVIVDSPSQGIFAQNTINFVIEENVFDDNGTSITHDHNIYMSVDHVGTLIRDNLLTHGSNFGIKFRGPATDGVIDGNVFSGNRNALQVHCKDEGEQNFNIQVTNNVAVETGHDGQHWALLISATKQLVVEGNIYANTTFDAGPAIVLAFAERIWENPNGNWPGIEDVTIRTSS